MAIKKISQLDEALTVNDDDYLLISRGGTSNYKVKTETIAAKLAESTDLDEVNDVVITTAEDKDILSCFVSGGVTTWINKKLSDISLGDFGGKTNLKLDDLGIPDDNTDLNATTSQHGLLSKLPGGTNISLRGDGTFGASSQKLDDFGAPDDNTDLNATTLRHGLLPKLSGDGSNVFRGDGSFSDLQLSELSGVSLTTPETDQVLAYNGANWINKYAESGVGGGHTIQNSGTNLETKTVLNFKNGLVAAVNGQSIDIECSLRENAIIGGGFDFFQRTAPATWTSVFERVSGAYPVTRKFGPDRWAVQCNETATDGTKVEVRRYNAALTGDTAGTKVAAFRRSAVGKIAAYQIIEASTSMALIPKTVSFQVSLRAGGNAQSVRVGIAKWTGTANAPSVRPIAASTTWTADPALAASFTWLANSASITVPTASFVTSKVNVDLSTHTTLTNLIVFIYNDENTTAANDVLYVKNAGLYPDKTQTQVWLPRPLELELVLCQSYFWKNYLIDSAPGSSGTPAYVFFETSVGAEWYLTVVFGVTMRVNPTITFLSKNGLTARASNFGGTDYGLDSAKFAVGNTKQVSVYNNSGSLMTIGGNFVYLGITADSEI